MSAGGELGPAQGTGGGGAAVPPAHTERHVASRCGARYAGRRRGVSVQVCPGRAPSGGGAPPHPRFARARRGKHRASSRGATRAPCASRAPGASHAPGTPRAPGAPNAPSVPRAPGAPGPRARPPRAASGGFGLRDSGAAGACVPWAVRPRATPAPSAGRLALVSRA